MDNEIDIPSGWMTSWTERTHPGLQTYSFVAYNVLSLTALILGIKAILRLRQTRRELIADPSSRAAIFSASSARTHNLTKGQFYIAVAYLIHALVFYSVDAVICFTAIQNDASANPATYDRAFILELAIYAVGTIAIFTAVFLLFPLLQILLCFKLLGRFHRNREDASTTLAAYIPEARILTTHIGQLWAMLAFVLMSYWPVYESGHVRLLLTQALFGSGIMWLQLSYGLNFRVKQLENIEVQQLLVNREAITKYGTQLFTRGKGAEGLPLYEPVPQTEQVLNEKA